MRTCAFCETELRKSPCESTKQYCARKYCGTDCVLGMRRARTKDFRNTEEAAIQNKARVMGGNPMVRNALLNPKKVRSIRELHNDLGFSTKEISELYNVKVDCVSKVLRGVTWAHVI